MADEQGKFSLPSLKTEDWKIHLVEPSEKDKLPTIEEWKEALKHEKPKSNIVEEIIPNAIGEFSIASGRTGIGKTNLLLNLAYCLATGTPFLGLNCQRVSVSYCLFEGGKRNIDERTDKIQLRYPPTEGYLRFSRIQPENPKALLDKIERITYGSQVIILDPLRYLVSGDYIKPRDAIQFLKEYRGLLDRKRAVGILAHNISKPNPNSLIEPGDVYQLKGATEYVDGAISVLLLEHKRQSPSTTDLILYFAKCKEAQREMIPIHLNYNYDKLEFEVVK